MSKKYRNPKTGEIFILEEEDEESVHTVSKKAPFGGVLAVKGLCSFFGRD